jgi:hypothetical protein
MNPLLAASALAVAHTFSHGAASAYRVEHRAEMRHEMRAAERAMVRTVYAPPASAQPVSVLRVGRFGHEGRDFQRIERLPGARVPFATHRGPRW